jgi:hypothetical protein
MINDRNRTVMCTECGIICKIRLINRIYTKRVDDGDRFVLVAYLSQTIDPDLLLLSLFFHRLHPFRKQSWSQL